MKRNFLLLCLFLITWTHQDKAETSPNDSLNGLVNLDSYYQNRTEEFDINEELEIAIDNADVNVNRKEVTDVESDEQADPAKQIPVDGSFGNWRVGACSRTCGGGVVAEARLCNNPFPAFGGKDCAGCVSKIRTCNIQRCPVNGGWSKWAETKCPCGVKTKKKTRTCSDPYPANGGKACKGKSTTVVPCKANPCPVDGGWTPWAQTPCSKSCGGGDTTRSRTCTDPEPNFGGKACSGDESITTSCNRKKCPVDGHWSPWNPFEKCSKSCEGGSKIKRRTCTNPAPANKGKKCAGQGQESADCNLHPCPKHSCLKPMDFVVLVDASHKTPKTWKKNVKVVEKLVDTIYKKFADAQISITIFSKKIKKITKFTKVGLYVNIKKKIKDLEKIKTTNVKVRRTDDALESALKTLKKEGRPGKVFKLVVLVTDGPSNRPTAAIKEITNQLKRAKITVTVVGVDLQKLPKNTKTKTIKEIKKIASSKKHVFIRTITELLNKKSKKLPIDDSFCAEDGAWTPWTETKCSKSCGGGTKTRARKCTNPAPKSNGKDCRGRKTDTLPCNKKHCPVNGDWSPWVETKCTKTCGGGQKARNRKCIGRKYGGDACKGKSTEVIACSKKPCPIDGKWTPWVSTKCSRTCGGGKIVRTRTCSSPKPQNNGKACPGLESKVVVCNAKKCPVDGNWSPWKEGSCSRSCGGGLVKLVRSCSNPPPSHNGRACAGEAMEVNTCNVKKCKVDGGWSPWFDGACSKSCGGGRKLRSRTCTKPSPAYGGKYCSKLLASSKKKVSCNNKPCPVDGNWSPWSEGPCSKSCGGGLLKKSRNCNNPRPKNNGKECAGAAKEDLACNVKACPVDGGWTPFGTKTPCTKTCGGGTSTRSRTCTKPAPANGGKDCKGKNTATKKCNTKKCPVNGNWSPWSKTPCTKTCGGGKTRKLRKCDNPPPSNGGLKCIGGTETAEKPCNKKKCPVPGGWTPWTSTKCTKTCGSGDLKRVRTCTKPKPANGGKKCAGPEVKSEKCNTKPCPVDGKWTPWSDAKCTKTCGGGTITRTRRCSNPPPKYKGKKCPGKAVSKKKCNAKPCPSYICKHPLDMIIVLDESSSLTLVDWKKEILLAEKIVKAAFTEHPKVSIGVVRFGATVKVDVTLKNSGGSYAKVIQLLKKLGKTKPKKTGKPWTRTDLGLKKAISILKKEKRAEATKIIVLLTDGYPSLPKKVGGKLTGFSATPIKSLQNIRNTVLGLKANILAVGFGINLLSTTDKKKTGAALKAIATDELMAIERTYTDLFKKKKLKEITDSLCPINGGLTEWNEKEVCSKTCGGGTRKLARSCTKPKPKFNGKKCTGKTEKTEKCNPTACPVDGKWTPWAKTKCSVSCNGGKLTRTRTCSKPPPKHNGKGCPGVGKEIVDCNTKKCPIDGNWTPWKPGSCSKTCGGGKEVLTRSCTKPAPQFKGKKCPGSKTKKIDCNEKKCPVDGHWSNWSPVTKCSKSCGKGSKLLERTCTKPYPKYGGKTCKGKGKKNVPCNPQRCPVDGKWTPWSDTKCTKTCDGGKRKRARTCTAPKPAFGGKACEGPKTLTIECNIQRCPTPGEWSSWEKEECSKSCGGGIRSITRKCDDPPPSNGGKNCPGPDSKEAPCNTHPCPVDGCWTPWRHGKCSRTCGGGLKKYTRTCSNPPPKNGGADCDGEPEKQVECNTKKCPIPGKWSPWSKWSGCTKSCGSGKIIRKRICNNPEPKFDGKACEGKISETAKCNVQPCKVCHPQGCKNCKCHGKQYKKGEGFTTQNCHDRCICTPANKMECKPLCSQSVFKIKKSCARGHDIEYKAVVFGKPYNTKSFKKCHCFKPKCVKSCPKGILCHDKQGKCGQFAKIGYCEKRKAFMLKNCPFSCSQTHCNPGPIAGGFTKWSIGKCSKQCGGGKETWTRACTNPYPYRGGKKCVGKTQTIKDCNTRSCPVDGGWSAWKTSKCSKSCGGGVHSKTRSCSSPPPSNGGKKCSGGSQQVLPCNKKACPPPCKKKTTKNVCCKFPFIYKGKSYSDCTKVNNSKLWCSTTSNYDKDNKWGNCKGSRSSINQGFF